MNEAIVKMLAKYNCQGLEDYMRALREILQEIALLGLWRSKFFEKGAFYGGTALRILHESDRFSEDLGFSLLSPRRDFNLDKYGSALERELQAFGFRVWVEKRNKAVTSPIQSTFLKADTVNELLVIQAEESLVREIRRGQILKIKLEVDTDPPPDFETETRYLLQPIPFAVRVYTLPDLFAGKMHAILCRKWKSRVKGRDWYDLVWYITHHPELHLAHLEQRLRQSGHWKQTTALEKKDLEALLHQTVKDLNVEQARREVEPFVKNPEELAVWSSEFFHDIVSKIKLL